MEVTMRRARKGDADAINFIFNQAIDEDGSNLDIDRKTRAYRERWLEEHDRRHPVFVGEVDGEIICWVSLSPYSDRYAYDWVAELSIYVRRDMRRKGLGTLLLKFIEKQAMRLGYYKIVLSVYASNRTALHTYRRAGYRDVGVFRSHGYHKGQLMDIMFMERLLPMPDMDFLKKYYRENYPFYQQYFDMQDEQQKRLREGTLHTLEEFEEVPVEDPSGLPEGIVRFLKSKRSSTSPDGPGDGFAYQPEEPSKPEPEEEAVGKRETAADFVPEAAASAEREEAAAEPERENDAGEEKAPEEEAALDMPSAPEPPAKPKKPRTQKMVLGDKTAAERGHKGRKKAQPDTDGPLEGQLLLEDIILKEQTD